MRKYHDGERNQSLDFDRITSFQSPESEKVVSGMQSVCMFVCMEGPLTRA
jgi:hypothetical protein